MKGTFSENYIVCMLCMQNEALEIDMMNLNENGIGGFKEVIFMITVRSLFKT